MRLKNEMRNVSGSGVIVAVKGQSVYLLTANHLLASPETATVQLFSAKSYPREEVTVKGAEVVAENKDADLALVKFAVRGAVPNVLPICPPELAPNENTFAVLTIGCSAEGAPTSVIDQVAAKKRIRKPDTKAAAWAWQTGGKPAEGRSGGAMIDKRGNLLGVCSGASDGKGYFCHIEEIHAFLKRNGFQSLFEKEKE